MRSHKLSIAVAVLAGSLLAVACAPPGAEPAPSAGEPAAAPPGAAAEATCRDAADAVTFTRGGALRRRLAAGTDDAVDGVPLCDDAAAPKTVKQRASDLSLRRRHAETRSND
ncbi:hypothetical protein ABI59_09240 [Acidobacteria bacterium Mor1]|nr:hypothetical protein ABI59_09240 [Acidobacteria bacterium Mor1]